MDPKLRVDSTVSNEDRKLNNAAPKHNNEDRSVRRVDPKLRAVSTVSNEDSKLRADLLGCKVVHRVAHHPG